MLIFNLYSSGPYFLRKTTPQKKGTGNLEKMNECLLDSQAVFFC